MEKQTLTVNGMSCQHCAHTIRQALESLGVTCRVDLETKTVRVEYDGRKVSLDAIKRAIEEKGYTVGSDV